MNIFFFFFFSQALNLKEYLIKIPFTLYFWTSLFVCTSTSLSQSIVNVVRDASEETEEEKEKKHKTFVEKYEKQIKHFGNVQSLFSSPAFLPDSLVLKVSLFCLKACYAAGMTARDISLTTPL